MKLYEIDELIARCVVVNDNEAVDTSTGEIIDIDYLEHLQMERSKKTEYLIKLYLNCLSDAEALKAEADKFSKRAKTESNKAEQIKNYLTFLQNGESFTSEDGLHKITHRKSQSVEVTDLSALEKRFLRYKEPEPDKKLISQALKEGYKVEGAQLINKLSIQIK